ncbi:TetR/AcrR family transcriptional regulator [Planococcus shenhongbingii]|uniref:TetR/AcrR family transcriptional regulator n=1 Tax=Planococcus shenhongbingii TaxID=3058398 RepID=UPI002625F4AB|nr:TetR/AcrR family transcriptional regulator [Planococcus sp. N016]WKA58358.1 TetR/AcrR family transcriptional regulator [Planococcus sp. N016]
MIEFEYLDKRVRRTKLDFYNAFIELLKQKKYEQITIKDIISLAGYSRGSFYNHYREKDDLLNEIIDSLFHEARRAQRAPYINEDSIDVLSLENEAIFILRHFKEYGNYYQTLLGENIRIDFRGQLSNQVVAIFLEDFDMEDTTEGNNLDKDLLNKYYGYGLIGVILDWVIADFPSETEDFSKELGKIFKYSHGTTRIKNKRRLH